VLRLVDGLLSAPSLRIRTGSFLVQWIPAVTGDFLIKAETLCEIGQGIYLCANNPTLVALAVLPVEAGQVFSVATNSTLSGLAYDAVDATLTFKLSGDNGEGARVDVSIAKSLLADPSLLRLKANSSELPFEFFSVGDSWLVTFTVHFESTFLMTMEITDGGTDSSKSVSTLSSYWPYFMAGAGLAVAGAYLFYRKSKALRSATTQASAPSSSSLKMNMSQNPLLKSLGGT